LLPALLVIYVQLLLVGVALVPDGISLNVILASSLLFSDSFLIGNSHLLLYLFLVAISRLEEVLSFACRYLC
jgi:hypothetical protein